MSEDPISKSQLGPGLGKPDVLKKSQGRGSIYTDKDYSKALPSSRSRIVFVLLCLISYVAVIALLYFSGVKILAIALSVTLLVLFLLVRYLARHVR